MSLLPAIGFRQWIFIVGACIVGGCYFGFFGRWPVAIAMIFVAYLIMILVVPPLAFLISYIWAVLKATWH